MVKSIARKHKRQFYGNKFTNTLKNNSTSAASTHLMVFIPTKINSPEYEDFIDMPVSSLPSTPVASNSHEPSQDESMTNESLSENPIAPESQ
ncbi:hypothetical protein TNCV_3597011 [Trichonephila clavipes]|nr:hypothetical protein TNCV_3597011 [Trichonephila clavipes]